MDSALYFDCPIGPEKIYKYKNKQKWKHMCCSIKLRVIDGLFEQKTETISHLNLDWVNNSMTFVKYHLENKSISCTTEFEERILSMLTNPNEAWKNLRHSYIKDK